MDFKVNSSDLLKAISHIHGIVEMRHTLPILSNIIITVKDDNLILSSTNLDIFCSEKTFCLQINCNFIILSDTILSNEQKYSTYFCSHVNL